MITSPYEPGERTLRKAAWRLIPLLAIGYAIAYMDRVNLGFASLQMNRDLGFSPQVYGFGAGIFFLSYAACELPANLLLLKFGARRWLARIMLTWGLVAGAMALVQGPRSFFALRFALGMAEAGFFPGVMYYLCLWFPTAMRARAISWFYIAFPLSSVLMGAVAGSLMGLDGRWGLAGWQWLFLVEAIPAVLMSAVIFFCLPDGPDQAGWLSAAERRWLAAELALAADDPVPSHGADWPAALRDPRTCGMGLFLFLTLGTSYAFSFCAPEIISRATGLGVSPTGWIVAAYSLGGAAAMIFNGAHSDRTRERRWHIVLPCLMMTIGLLIGGLSTLPWVTVGSIAWTSLWFYSLQGPALAAPSRFLNGKSMAAGFAVINMFSIVSGFAAPYLMGLLKSRLGDFQSGLTWLALPSLLGGAVMFCLLKPVERVVPNALLP
jgi:ACS family tartrate transporter-like MFS transporter